MIIPFALPPLSPYTESPVWNGQGFQYKGKTVPVLEYSSNLSGWNDDLTHFHEETTGENHFIDQASRQNALRSLCKDIKIKTPVILEIGCSSGYMLKSLAAVFPHAVLIGSDVVTGALHQLAISMPHIPLMKFDITSCPLPDRCIDAVVLLNVLEHIENDTLALEQVYRILKPGGIVYIEVPAGPSLFDMYDTMLLHKRRYSLSSLKKTVKKAGFSVNRAGHLGFLMYPGFWLVKKRNRQVLHKSDKEVANIVAQNVVSTGNSTLLSILMQIELFFGKFISYPFGIRCILSCKKSC